MITGPRFCDLLTDTGVRRLAGVPCGSLAGAWAEFDRRRMLIPAADEGAALAIAVGSELAGVPSAVLCQNSGLGNLLNPLTSLVLPYRVPVLVVMSLRGWPDPALDEPQHAVMGPATTRLLDALDVEYTVLAPTEASAGAALTAAAECRRAGSPFFVLVPPATIEPPPAAAAEAGPAPEPADPRPSRSEVVAALLAVLAGQARDTLVVATTGYLSRELHAQRDRPGTFYMQGSMGHAAAITLGLALGRPDRRVLALDGDGALLMHLGTGSTIGSAAPPNLTHLVVDNGCYESTGGQPSTSAVVDWPALGQGLGYRTVLGCPADGPLAAVLSGALTGAGPVLCVVSTRPVTAGAPPRASATLTLPDIAARLRTAG